VYNEDVTARDSQAVNTDRVAEIRTDRQTHNNQRTAVALDNEVIRAADKLSTKNGSH